jgi:hypothetical protein
VQLIRKVWGKMVMSLSQYKNHTVLLSSAAEKIEHGVLSSIVQSCASSTGRGGVKVPLQIATPYICPHYRLCHSISVFWSHMILKYTKYNPQYITISYMSYTVLELPQCLKPSKCRTPRALCIHRRRYLGWRNQRQAPSHGHVLLRHITW